LGHNVMDHHFRMGATGQVEGFEDFYFKRRRPAGFYIPRLRNTGDDKRKYLRGVGYQGSASRSRSEREFAELSIGADYQEALTEPGGWTIGMTAFGEMLPYHENRVKLDHEKKDKWGLPVLSMNVEMKQNELDMREDMVNDAVEMFEAVGIKN